jgi:hypothetical protein
MGVQANIESPFSTLVSGMKVGVAKPDAVSAVVESRVKYVMKRILTP